MDWPFLRQPALVTIHTFSQEALGLFFLAWGNLPVFAASTSVSANTGYLYPFTLGQRILVDKVWWYNGSTVGGNIDVGVYDEDFVLLAHSGIVVTTGTNAVQLADISDVSMGPGRLYLAFQAGSSVSLFSESNSSAVANRMAGVLTGASAAPPLAPNAAPSVGNTANTFIVGLTGKAII